MANLPFELITSILTRLPVKSLVRFKCVSKEWNSLISNPHLIALHLTQSLSSNNRLLIINYGTHLESTPLLLSSETEVKTRRFDLPSCFSGFEVSVCGSCNGLVALVCKKITVDNEYNDVVLEVVLWNPSTNSHFVVPHAYENDDLLSTEFLGVSFGFGYDGAKDDYKIVRIVDYFHSNNSSTDDDDGNDNGDGVDDVDGNGGDGDGDDNDGGDDEGGDGDDDDGDDDSDGEDHRCKYGFIFRDIMVYSLRDNCWNKIHVAFFGDKMEWFCPGAVINNHLVHWIFWNYRKRKPILRGFNLSTFIWTKLALPNFRGNNNGNHNKTDCPSDDDDDNDDGDLFDHGFKPTDFVVLGVLDECLCLVTRICPEFDNVYVWVMREYGVKESWTKLFDVTEASVVGPLLSTPLACCKGDDELLLRKHNEDGFCWYDRKGKTVKAAPKLPSCNLKLHDVKLCVESLVPLAKMTVDGSDDRRLDEANG